MGRHTRPRPRAGFLVAVCSGGLCIAPVGCGVRPVSPYPGIRVDPAALTNPFAPVMMQIHPLTRIDRDVAGDLWIICHIEMRDVWGDPVKGAGEVQIQLYRPVGRRVTGLGVQELTWDIDLLDMENNARLYDAATRTYRLPLREAPEWLGDVPEGGAARGLLIAILTTVGPQGEELSIQHEFALH
jgi:hypothetical protein